MVPKQGWQNAGKYEYFPCRWHLLENTGKYRKIEFTTLELKTKPYTQHLSMVNFNKRG